ncbi:hypothetical protein MTBUT4_790005 [Magnetospirillum sp. UT-4]|nr:hypothetical protein MTBUT4_790005 [Magnetospirillum sp. UT-4]
MVYGIYTGGSLRRAALYPAELRLRMRSRTIGEGRTILDFCGSGQPPLWRGWPRPDENGRGPSVAFCQILP